MAASTGDTVRVHYTGRLQDDDQTVFDTSEEREPLEFTIGQEQLIPGFESAVVGMEEGQEKTVSIPADEAYGRRREDLILSVDRENMSGEFEPEKGQRLQMQQQDGTRFTATVLEVTDDAVTLDANHPLAGQDLTFDIQLLEIE